MSEETYDFSDTNTLTNKKPLSLRKCQGGCYVSLIKGIIVAAVSVLAVVLIAVIVHVTGNVSESELIEECAKLSSEGNAQICDACAPKPAPPKNKTDVRLPKALVPMLYELRLRPNIYGSDHKKFNFTGNVHIHIYSKIPTENVTLHMNDLNIDEKSIRVYGEKTTYSVKLEYDNQRQFLILKLNQKMQAHHMYHVVMNFTGPLEYGLNGLYLSSYKRGSETVYLAASQLQATDARKVFPCFDEPEMKAEYDIIIERQTSKKALSNMPVNYTKELEGDWVADHFQRLPKISTYILAFIVSDYEFLENMTEKNVTYQAWVRPEAKSQAEYGLTIGVDVLTFFEGYFDIPYPLPKQAMIALQDLSFGAMENWGLITYRESTMLFDHKESSEIDKQEVAVVIAHEVAHQWFGDLVTPAWWDDIWLNEGFARFMEYFGVINLETGWKMFEQFIVKELHTSFSFDGLVSSHPLFVPVADPAEITEVFDLISYSKGASVIRMAKFFMGNATFKTGLSNYLKSLKYGSAAHNDLWHAWGNQSVADGNVRTDVKEIMDTWILQMNYPVVTIERTPNGLTAKQDRFLLDSNATDPKKYKSPFGYKWDIPLTYTHETEKKFTDKSLHWMKRNNIDIKDTALPKPEDNQWILVNVEQLGYYRVNYEEHNWKQLLRQLHENHTVIPTINRAQIINDAWNLARAGMLDIHIALNTTEYLGVERDYIPWGAALVELDFVGTMLQRHELHNAFGKFMADKLKGYFDEIGMNSENGNHMELLRRSQILTEACSYDIQKCVDKSLQLYRQWMNNSENNTIDPNIQYAVYCTSIRHGGVEEWDFAYKHQKMSNVAGVRSRLRSAMACSSKPWILSRYLHRTLFSEDIRQQDAVDAIVSISKNAIGRPLVWDFVRENWHHLMVTFDSQPLVMSYLIKGITEPFNTNWDLEQLHDFKLKNPKMGSGSRAYDQAIELTRSNIKWMDRNIPVIKTWLEKKGFL